MITAIESLISSFTTKGEFYSKKWRRARKVENMEVYRDKTYHFQALSHRASDLYFRIKLPQYAFVNSRVDYENRLKRKEERRQDFLEKYRYAKHFMSDSLGADYGKFTCEKCGCTFYHSPSTILLGVQVVHECCCGDCTNHYIAQSWGIKKQPYY